MNVYVACTHLRVGVIRRLEPDIRDTHLLEENTHEPDQIRERQFTVRNDTLDLVELSQMRRVHRLVSEHAVDTEQLGRAEPVVCFARFPLDAAAGAAVVEVLAVAYVFATTFCGELVEHV